MTGSLSCGSESRLIDLSSEFLTYETLRGLNTGEPRGIDFLVGLLVVVFSLRNPWILSSVKEFSSIIFFNVSKWGDRLVSLMNLRKNESKRRRDFTRSCILWNCWVFKRTWFLQRDHTFLWAMLHAFRPVPSIDKMGVREYLWILRRSTKICIWMVYKKISIINYENSITAAQWTFICFQMKHLRHANFFPCSLIKRIVATSRTFVKGMPCTVAHFYWWVYSDSESAAQICVCSKIWDEISRGAYAPALPIRQKFHNFFRGQWAEIFWRFISVVLRELLYLPRISILLVMLIIFG